MQLEHPAKHGDVGPGPRHPKSRFAPNGVHGLHDPAEVLEWVLLRFADSSGSRLLPRRVPQGALGGNSQLVITISNGTSYQISTVVDNPAAPTPPPANTATHLAFLVQPTGGTANNALSPAPVVAVEDADGNVVTGDSSIGLALNDPSDASGAQLSSTCNSSGISDGAGVVTFNGCSITRANPITDGGYTLTATDGSLTQATSAAFNIAAGTPSQLAFGSFPTIKGGSPFSISVTVEDLGGTPVKSDNSSVTLALSPLSTGTGTLSGCSLVGQETNGVFNFKTARSTR